MTQRTVDLRAARRLLLSVSVGLKDAAVLLIAGGLGDDGRTASRMGDEVVAMRKRVRKAHNVAINAERNEPTGESR